MLAGSALGKKITIRENHVFNFNFFYIFTGEKGIPAEKVAQEAVQSLINDIKSQGCVDQYMQDQLVRLKI